MDEIYDLEITFGKSKSSSYDSVVKLCKNFKNYIPISESNNLNLLQLSTEEIFNNEKLFDRIFLLISGWKSCVFIANGIEVNPHSYYYQLKEIINCSNYFKKSNNKDKHCNITESIEGWGCKFLTEIKLNLKSNTSYYDDNRYWYEIGYFNGEHTWVINKSKIKELLKNEATTKRTLNCSYFSIDKIFNKVDDLPDYINLLDSSDWEVKYQEDFVGTTIQQKAIGIKHIDKSKEFDEDEEIGNYDLFNLKEAFEDELEVKTINQDRTRYVPEITFNDIGGIDNIIDQIREVIELPLKRPDVFSYLGIKPHKGILLYGEPGNGKTLVAKAIANEVNAHFIPVSGPELVSKYHGQSEENLRNIFKEARKHQPTIIFFDEIDSIAQKRSDDETARMDAKFVNQLLTLMDGMEKYENVAVLASTNRPELLDEALLRPGRFDYKIEIQKPDEIGCYKILQITTRNMPLDRYFDISKIVPFIHGFSGAEITFIVKEAALNALKRTINVKSLIVGSDEKIDMEQIRINQNDFMNGINKLKQNKI